MAFSVGTSENAYAYGRQNAFYAGAGTSFFGTGGQETGRRNTAAQKAASYLNARSAQTISHTNDNKELLAALHTRQNDGANLTGEQKRKANFAYTGTLANKQGGFLDTRTQAAEAEQEQNPVKKYNHKDISGQIQRAKTSLAAGQVLIKAKRAVLEIKRKLAAQKGDVEELGAALNHARRMERVAKKKKHHLEIEELVEHKQKGGLSDGGEFDEMRAETYGAVEDKLDEAQESIDRVQEEAVEAFEKMYPNTGMEDFSLEPLPEYVEDMAGEATEALPDEAVTTDAALLEEAYDDEMLAALDELLEEMGGEQQEMLEELEEQLGLLETVDPNMSKEELKELKTKHRQSERKDIVKADMEYLKALIEYYQKKEARMDMPVSADLRATGSYMAAMQGQSMGAAISMPGGEGIVETGINVVV